MAFFEKRSAAVEPQAAGVAECDAKIAQLEKKKQEITYKLGAKYAENNTAADATGTIYAEELSELENIAGEIDATEVRKLALQGLRRCEKCGNVLVSDSAFCNKCGEKLEPLKILEQPAVLRCPKCGSPVEAGAAFCVSCGNKL